MAPQSTMRTASRGLRKTAASALTLAAVVLALAILAPALAGLQRYVITSDSMTGTYDRGSVIYDKVVPTASLKVGDVITYTPPAGAGPGGLVTHRIIKIDRARDGRTLYETEGDANPSPDPWGRFELREPRQAKVISHLPYLGYAIAALSNRHARMLVVGLPALVIAFLVLAGTWQDAGAEARRRRTGAGSPVEVAGS